MKERKRLGLALCGSYCTYEKVLKEAEKLAADWDLTALMSETAACTDSRFGKAEDFIARLEALTGKGVMRSIVEAERVGPEKLFDVLAVSYTHLDVYKRQGLFRLFSSSQFAGAQEGKSV